MDMYLTLHQKARDWHYEKEYRITRLWNDRIPSTAERIALVNDSCMKEVIVGMCISDVHKQEILENAKRKRTQRKTRRTRVLSLQILCPADARIRGKHPF